MALEQDGLDPVNFVSIPGLSWDSAFKMTGTSLDLLQDSVMYEFFEAGIRGGMTFVNTHHIRSNKPGEEDYDPLKPHTELLYIDANNLYGQALSMSLPQKNFKWVEDMEMQKRLVESLPHMNVIRGKRGFVAEVDLEIPTHLHDLLDDLPLAPEKSKVTWDMFTPYMVDLHGGTRGYRGTEKLLLTHLPKSHYVIHCALLQFYLKMGILVTKIHRIVTFDQSPFFEPYISFK
jgi:hypothetical protein